MLFPAKTLLSISILAGILSCVADVLLLHAPGARYETMDYQFLLQIPLDRLLWGHYLGVLAIPFELPGLMLLALQFRPISPRAPYFVGAAIVFVMMMGLVYHGNIVLVGDALQHSSNPIADIERLRPYFDPFGSALAGIFIVLSLAFAWVVFRGKTELPRKMLLANPLLSYLFCVLFYVVYPPLGAYFIVAGFNFSITILLISLRLAKGATF